MKIFEVDNSTLVAWKPHFFDGAWYMGLFELDNMTWGTWKPHLIAKVWLLWIFKIDDVIGGIWKSNFLLKKKSRLWLLLPSFPLYPYFFKCLTCFDLNACLRLTTLHGGLAWRNTFGCMDVRAWQHYLGDLKIVLPWETYDWDLEPYYLDTT